MATTPRPVSTEDGEHPGFASEQLAVDVQVATEVINEAMAGLVATETDEGTAFRTRDGMLIAFLRGDDGSSDVYYRTAPASDARTLKARRLWRALKEYTD